jgi:ABC-type Fe3+-hydroxamate transport system substrate-binding protein
MCGSSAVGRLEADDLGFPVQLPPVVHRVVSLVPSLTEAVAASESAEAVGAGRPGLLAGVTDWCTHPPGLRGSAWLARLRLACAAPPGLRGSA